MADDKWGFIPAGKFTGSVLGVEDDIHWFICDEDERYYANVQHNCGNRVNTAYTFNGYEDCKDWVCGGCGTAVPEGVITAAMLLVTIWEK
jgi:hypothetical protein